MALQWERLEGGEHGGVALVERAWVPGGWLVRSVLVRGVPPASERVTGVGVGLGLAFVPDPNCNWSLE